MNATWLAALIPLTLFLCYRQFVAWERNDVRRQIEQDPETTCPQGDGGGTMTAILPIDLMAEVLAEVLAEAWNIEHATGPKDATTGGDWEDEAAQVVQGLTERDWKLAPDNGSKADR